MCVAGMHRAGIGEHRGGRTARFGPPKTAGEAEHAAIVLLERIGGAF